MNFDSCNNPRIYMSQVIEWQCIFWHISAYFILDVKSEKGLQRSFWSHGTVLSNHIYIKHNIISIGQLEAVLSWQSRQNKKVNNFPSKIWGFHNYWQELWFRWLMTEWALRLQRQSFRVLQTLWILPFISHTTW